MKRFGQVIRIKPEKLAEYKRYHAKVWPEILRKITECNIRNLESRVSCNKGALS